MLTEVIALDEGHDGTVRRHVGEVFTVDTDRPELIGADWFVPVGSQTRGYCPARFRQPGHEHEPSYDETPANAGVPLPGLGPLPGSEVVRAA